MYSAFDEKPALEDIQHYGRLGMKWGKRIFGEEQAYQSANKKLAKLDKKATAAGNKAAQKEAKSVERQSKADSATLFRRSKARSADRAIAKSEKTRQNYVKQMVKASSWYKAMEREFGNSKVSSLSAEYQALGKKYARIQINDLMKNAQTSVANKQLRAYYQQMGRR